jgi:hypothetical protein
MPDTVMVLADALIDPTQVPFGRPLGDATERPARSSWSVKLMFVSVTGFPAGLPMTKVKVVVPLMILMLGRRTTW